MELRDFAERLLFGETLTDKLAKPGPLRDERPGLALSCVPVQPGRPGALTPTHKGVDAFPSLSRMREPQGRGRVLHAFANHELLAIELMALALLRFPDAPAAFRWDLARTIVEEQRHLRAYLRRMEALGVQLGDVSVSGWFWRALKDVDSPAQFSACMGMTLEQANLDFAVHFRDLFADMGDAQTSELLAIVHRDEIRHVTVGHRWFEAFRDPGQPLFQAWQAALPPSLEPVRAKGIGFDEEGRRTAGLPGDYIEQVLLAQGSKGRPPHVFWPNFEAEITLQGDPIPAPAQRVREELGPLMIFLAGRDDVVLLDRDVPRAHQVELARRGFTLPRLHVGDTWAGPSTSLRPWAHTPAAGKVSATLQTARGGSLPALDETPAQLFHKTADVALRAHLGQPAPLRGVAVDSADALSSVQEAFPPGHTVRWKTSLGTAGRGQGRLAVDELASPPRALLKALRRGPLVFEPEHERLADVSLLLHSGMSKPVRALRPMCITSRGQYAGHLLGPQAFRLWPQHLQQLLFRPQQRGGTSLMAEATAMGGEIARWLLQQGYEGPASVDLMMVREAEGARWAIAECNPRLTMGHVGLAIERQLQLRDLVAWLHLPADLARSLLAACDGAWPTTPLAEDTRHATVWVPLEEAPGLASLPPDVCRFLGVSD